MSHGEVILATSRALNDQMQRLHAHDGNPIGAGEEQQKFLLSFQRQLVKDFPENADRGMIGGKFALRWLQERVKE